MSTPKTTFSWLLASGIAVGLFLGSAGTSFACSPGDLIISKQGPATAHVGDTITYTVKPEQAIKKNKTGSVNITVKDILPAGLTVLSADLVPLGNSWSQDTIDNHGAPECVVNGSTVQCHLPILGQPDKNNHVTEALITIKAKVEQELACTTIKNQATIAGERDKNTSNNISEWVTTEITGSCVTTTPTPTPTPSATPTVVQVVINNINENKNSNKITGGNSNVTTGNTNVNVKTGDQKVVIVKEQAATTKKHRPAIAGTTTYAIPPGNVVYRVPITAKTGGVGVISLLTTLLGGSGLAIITRRRI